MGAKFKKKTNTSQEIPTSSLPDIIFMLLFFFMVTTVMRETDILVEQQIPRADQIQKLEKKSLVSFIYVGKPKEVAKYGEEPRVQVNDVLITPDNIPMFVLQEKSKLSESDKSKLTMSLKVDKRAKMGVVIDVRQKLREAETYKVNYAALKEVKL